MQCPSCDAPLSQSRYEGQFLRQCSGCSGYLVEQNNLKIIERKREVNVPAVAAGTTTREPGEEFILLCPKCQVTMKKFRYGKQPPVTVDQCHRCHALWLDAGELEAIQASFELWEDGMVQRRPSHERHEMTPETTAAMFAHSLEKPSGLMLLLRWALSLVIFLGPAVLIFGKIRELRFGEFVLIYLAVWAVLFLIARFATFNPDMNDLGWCGGLINRPFSYSDDANRTLLFLKVIFALPKFILSTAADTFDYFG